MVYPGGRRGSRRPDAGGGGGTARARASSAGVSQSAVSRAFSPDGKIAPATRARVLSAAKTLGIPFFQTICGGAGPKDPPLCRSLISLSHEVKRQVLSVSDLQEDDLTVVPARLDIRGLEQGAANPDRAALAVFRAKYRLPETSRVLMRVVRHAPEYEASLIAGADAVLNLYRAGMDVRLSRSGVRPVGAVAGLTAYRVVQEALTNVLKHAGPCATDIALSVSDDALIVCVVDDGAGPRGGNGGHGLVGMRERVSVLGGTLDAGTLDSLVGTTAITGNYILAAAGTLQADATGSSNGVPVRLVGHFEARGKRFYQVIVLGKANALPPEQVEQFLTSFSL